MRADVKISTQLAQAGSRGDATGAVSAPIYHAATFGHPALGQSTGYDYSRTANPTRSILEKTLAQLDNAARVCTFSSGLAAIDAVWRLFNPGDEIIVTEDLYGGTFRLCENLYRRYQIIARYADTSNCDAVRAAVTENTRAIFVEMPTNPLLKIADLRELAAIAQKNNLLLIADNTFLTPALLRPLDFGVDLAVYSGTKFLNGHNDVIAGAVAAKTAELGEKIAYYQNAAGAILAPQESWLLLRGLKTLAIRMERAAQNALKIARALAEHPRIEKVYYPGLETDCGNARWRAQISDKNFGAMLSLRVREAAQIAKILGGVQVFIFAESLGGVESLITFPSRQTHADFPIETLKRLRIDDNLLRLSIGIEDADDLLNDLLSVL